ncbi:MAG: sulfur carrier protein ThiS [Thermodesulfobacteriota bacterium]
MKIRINGQTMEVDEGATLGRVLAGLDIPLKGTAVEVNREIVPRRLLEATPVREGDAVEVIRMVGGG